MQVPIWYATKKLPKEVIWISLVFCISLISTFLSNHPWTTLKSTILFMVSGPFIFIISKHLFASMRNQDTFLWTSSLIALLLGLWGAYEHMVQGDILLLMGNPLPAGAMILLLLASPMILLTRDLSKYLRFALILTLIASTAIIILLAKKGPLLGLMFVILFLAIVRGRKYLTPILGWVFLAGLLVYFLAPWNAENKPKVDPIYSISARAESFFFGLHIIKKHPIFGIGFKSDPAPYLENYTPKFPEQLSKEEYSRFITNQRTFENIFVAFAVELGGLFTAIYFGGVLYMFYECLKKSRSPYQKDNTAILIFSVMTGFTIISCTFDTLRYPNLNWMFHSLLGLMMNPRPENLTNQA